jgi:hypothetical protein
LNYELNDIKVNIQSKINSNSSDVNSTNQEYYIKLNNKIENLQSLYLNDLIGCQHVYDGIEYMEYRVCRQGIKYSYYLIACYSWLFLAILLFAVAVNKLKPLVEKKKSELEVNNYNF